MKHFVLLFVIAAFFVSCSEKEVIDDTSASNTYEITVSDSISPVAQTANAATYNLLGYGYDATGYFFNSASGKAKVLEIEKLIEQHPGNFAYGYPRAHYSTMRAGLTAVELVKALSEETDDYFRPISDNSKFNMFCGQLTAAFDKATLTSDQSVFGFYQEYILERSYAYYDGADTLTNYLTEAFRTDVQNETPEYILEKYGTHVLTSVALGGKIQVLYKSNIPSGEKEWLSTVGLTNAVQMVMGQSMRFTNAGENSSNLTQKVYVHTSGGLMLKSWHGWVSRDTMTAPIVNIVPWFKSVESNLSLINVPSGHMIPIYELVGDETKKAALRKAFDAYFQKSKSTLSGN